MYKTSAEYKEMMQRDLRERSYVYVFLGLINRDAQGGAEITSQLTEFSNNDVYGTSEFEAYYATAEENFATDDTFFLPSADLYDTLNQGAVSNDILGSITFTFNKTIDKMGGLTIDFGDVYPTEFTVTNGEQTFTYENDHGGRYIAEGNMYDSDYVTITPISMVGGQQRMRIHSILFGIGFEFDNHDLISTKRVNETSHLSLELPKKTFDFTISNYDQKWTMDNPDSYARALEEQHLVQVTYGRELDDGSIFKLNTANMALSNWNSTHETASFSAVGYLDYSNTTFYAGKVKSISLYDLAKEVLADMGVTNYKLDSYLKKMWTNNPLPIDHHKACLQMIANAGQCTMYEDNNGKITLKSSIILPEFTVSADNIESYSNVPNLTNGNRVYNFASAEKDYATDETYFFEEVETEQTGVVSHIYPTEDMMTITIEFEAMWTFVGLTFMFGIIKPEMIVIDEYNDGTLMESNEFPVVDLTQYINHEFYEVDKVVIHFEGVEDGQRVHLNKLQIGSVTNYEITEKDMNKLPTSIQIDRIRNINVKYYEFIRGNKRMTTQVNADKGDNLVTLTTPCYNYSVPGCTILDSGAYFVIFRCSSERKVTITATEYIKSEQTYSYQLRKTGQDLVLENDLISSATLAQKVAKWFAEYYAGEVDYTLQYRGEPALECGDKIYLENRFVDNNLILVTSEELSTSTGMSFTNTVKARQLSYKRKDE